MFLREYRLVRRPEKEKRRRKNLLLMQGCYSFWESGGNLFHLFGVPDLMGSDQLKPLLQVQGAKKGVGHVIFSQVLSCGLLRENPGAFTDFAELREHFFLLADERRVEGNRRLARDEARLD